ncbi:hypothetical protein CCH79_00014884 [Gambusia affinis]|uniref:DnaJ homolog subfamily C member 22 n=1 Tax=Gambusia affinis TaxID=33528 RepID=A0A315VZC5_GAMAF|nr:hypothetical protein CCH79_00014884 [Gambusia affinis]
MEMGRSSTAHTATERVNVHSQSLGGGTIRRVMSVCVSPQASNISLRLREGRSLWSSAAVAHLLQASMSQHYLETRAMVVHGSRYKLVLRAGFSEIVTRLNRTNYHGILLRALNKDDNSGEQELIHCYNSMVKRVLVAYALWAMGGPLGLHHLYLGRDSHALLWMLTLGGFGFGWAREFIRIPAYVSEANRDAKKERGPPKEGLPPVSPVRFAGQVCVGIYFGIVALIGLNSLSFFYLIVLPLSVGAGVHLVSSVGQQTADLQKTLTACLVTSPIFYGSSLSPLPISLAASITASQHRRFKPPKAPGSQQKLATLYYLSDSIAALLDIFWFLPWLRSVLEYFLLMPYRVLCALTGGGYHEEAWRKVLEILLKEYTHKEKEALKVLSLETEASLEEITRSYRELAKTWHPDHNPNNDAEKMFMKQRLVRNIAQVGLTRSVLDDSCVHADNSLSRNSCNTLPPPPRLAASRRVSPLSGAVREQIGPEILREG